MTLMEDLFTMTTPFDFVVNAYDGLQTISHGLFIYIFIPLPFLAIWITSKKVIIPSILYMIIGGAVAVVAPWELKKPAMLMLGFGLSGIVAKWFMRNR